MGDILWIRGHIIAAMVLMFSLLIVTTYWPGRKKSVERDAMIPLRDDK